MSLPQPIPPRLSQRHHHGPAAPCLAPALPAGPGDLLEPAGARCGWMEVRQHYEPRALGRLSEYPLDLGKPVRALESESLSQEAGPGPSRCRPCHQPQASLKPSPDLGWRFRPGQPSLPAWPPQLLVTTVMRRSASCLLQLPSPSGGSHGLQGSPGGSHGLLSHSKVMAQQTPHRAGHT